MDFEFSTELAATSELSFDTNIDFDKDYDLDMNIDVDVDIEGNVATLTFDVLAVGDGSADTLAEVDVFVLAVEDELSQVAGSMIAAVD